MRLCILVPSEEYKSYAGARIRYNRLARHLAKLETDIFLEDIAVFDPSTAICDAVVISKCHDPRSLVVAAALSERGVSVGVDLFDDYFSDRTDSRLLSYQRWLSQLVEICTFTLCSTKAMADVARRYRSDLPCHILNDPAASRDPGILSQAVAKKVAEARDNRRLEVVWFGVGDNPYFPVGLSDVAVHGAVLADLAATGMDVNLNVITNRRALGAKGLDLIAHLPIKTRIREWNESAEREGLSEALLAFLPVNAQSFSRAKSLNRAITALSAGSQILSVGYPLYEDLNPFIYRDSQEFLRDLAKGEMRLSPKSLVRFEGVIGALADPLRESQRLAGFLDGLTEPAESHPLPLAVIHGRSTLIDVHRLVRMAKGISVASPYCSASLDFDVVFRATQSTLEMLVSREASRRIVPSMRGRLKGTEWIAGRRFNSFWGAPRAWNLKRTRSVGWGDQPLPIQLATYDVTMRQIERKLTEAFGQSRTIISETSRFPFCYAPVGTLD